MKKLIMAVTAVAGLGLGVANGGDINVDFDGHGLSGLRSISFESINTIACRSAYIREKL